MRSIALPSKQQSFSNISTNRLGIDSLAWGTTYLDDLLDLDLHCQHTLCSCLPDVEIPERVSMTSRGVAARISSKQTGSEPIIHALERPLRNRKRAAQGLQIS